MAEKERKNFWENFTEGTGSVWILQDQNNLYCQRWNTFAVYNQRVQTLSFHSPVMPRPVLVSLAAPCRTNYAGQPSKSPRNKRKPFVDWIWPAGSQEGFWALTNAQRKENPLSLPLCSLYLLSLSSTLQLAGCVDAHALSWVWLKQRDENGRGELGSFRADSPRGSWQDGRNAPALWTYFQQLCLLNLVLQCQQWAVSHLHSD